MQIDKRIVVGTIMKANAPDIVALSASPAEKDSAKRVQMELAQFMRKADDYMIVAVRK